MSPNEAAGTYERHDGTRWVYEVKESLIFTIWKSKSSYHHESTMLLQMNYRPKAADRPWSRHGMSSLLSEKCPFPWS